ncbi:MAG TPA: hypothetical protein VKC53_01930 [Patescibacteria group bacterium]|nr:hypothetical protein [Patescibacteria group bacterium]
MSHDPPGTTYKIDRGIVDADFFKNKLKQKNLEVKKAFNETYPHVEKFFNDRGISLSKIREHSAKVITAGALTGTLLFSPPIITNVMPNPTEIVKNLAYSNNDKSAVNSIPPAQSLLSGIQNYLPDKIGPLTRSQEKNIEKIFSDTVGVSTKANLEGEHLNTTYGYIGAEQHLVRYPGDTIANHDLTPDDEGMAPGKGAWGYFAPSKDKLTEQDVQNEKWYAVVQTLYLPDWSNRQPYLRNWYKYRKVLVVNTINGNAVVADVADSGPAAFTGKQFGGSPEVMNYLGGSRYKKGPVIIFFVDDPQNKVRLGPVEYNNVNVPDVTLTAV